ncbi:MAG: energy-coupling factor transporter transmembrane protein EcfT [Deltaproteobacteria bacterium]|nr:energy-coupling factor transporter transmembrane protein EcfT [Deltaproteobacteria bacterium]MBW2254869.1 energy-coupling factor transporter transmembrane protein EcfT [Deltaproteobacteria bacterium]
MDPRTRLGLVVAVGLLAVLLDRPASLVVLCALSSAPLLLLPIGWTWRRRAVLAAVAVVWSTVLSQGLFYTDLPRIPLLHLGPVVIYREGVVHGLVQSLRLVSVTFAGVALAVSTPPDRLFAALLRLHVPYGLAFLAVTALRFVPVVGQELLVVRRARAHRGRPSWARPPWDWLRLEIALLRPVVARAVRRARSLAEALDSRGFDPTAPRAVRRPLHLAAWEPALLVGVYGVVLAVGAAQGLYWLYVGEVVYLPELRDLYGAVRVWL